MGEKRSRALPGYITLCRKVQWEQQKKNLMYYDPANFNGRNAKSTAAAFIMEALARFAMRLQANTPAPQEEQK